MFISSPKINKNQQKSEKILQMAIWNAVTVQNISWWPTTVSSMRKWLIRKHKLEIRVKNTRTNGSNINVAFANYDLCRERINWIMNLDFIAWKGVVQTLHFFHFFNRLNSGIMNCQNFFLRAIFYFKKLKMIQWMMLILGISIFLGSVNLVFKFSTIFENLRKSPRKS